MVTGINRVSEQTLASLLSSGQLLAPSEALEVLREIVRRVVDLHDSGHLHLGITLNAISIGPDGIKLTKAQGTASLEFLHELLRWSPEAIHRLPRSLPTNLAAARQVLHSVRVSTDPCTFDLLAIGEVFCRILTGESIAAYRQSVRVKGLVPVGFRSLLERFLGADGQSSFESAQSLWDFIREQYGEDFDAHPTLGGHSEDFQPAPTPTGHDSNTGLELSQSESGTAPRPVERSKPSRGTEQLPFQKLGHFEIQARIGRGGMGDVYRAYDRRLDRTVAIKVLPAEFARQTDFVRRFEAEASAVAKLVHPNIIQIYFIGIDSGHHFFAMQYIDGFSLAVLLNEKKRLPINKAVPLVEQVLLGLQEAHSLGFVHRDIKPGNILIDRVRQRALVADFGLVKMVEGPETGMTATGVILGTVDYLSPEQALGKEVDARSDLYSIGVLLYHMLSGRLPFIADTPTALIFQHVYEQPRPLIEVAPQVAEPLAAIVNRLLQKNPADRYQSAQDVLTDLAAFRNKQPLVIASLSDANCTNEVVRSPPVSASPIEKLIFAEKAEPSAERSGWQRWLTRWRARFQQHAPQRLLELQNTQQQVQGALAVYQTRREDLEKLVREAQDVRDDLARAAAQSKGTSEAASLEKQLSVQDEQLDDLKLKLARVSSTLQQLLSQRDLLNARLKAAGAQLQSDGQIMRRGLLHKRLILMAATAAMLVVAIVIIGQFVRKSTLAVAEGTSAARPEEEPVTVTANDNGERLRNSIGMEFVRIPPGEFMMGSPIHESGRDDDEQQHLVRITQPFFMGIHEVTRGQFEQFVSETGYKTNAETDEKGGHGIYPGVGSAYEKRFSWRDSGIEQTNDHPVGNVTWHDASAFVRWLSEKENVVYRLPTEAETEYACRAGGQTPYQTGTVQADIVKVANVLDLTFCNEVTTKYGTDVSEWESTPGTDGFVFTAPVGSLAANPFGLHDMIGNVDEWCSDWFDENYFRYSPVNDPTGPETGVFRSFRGGFWSSFAHHTRSANRSRFEPDHRAHHIGFRVVRNITSNTTAMVDHAEVTTPVPSAGTEALIEGLNIRGLNEAFAEARAAYDRSPQNARAATRFINLIEELGISLIEQGNRERGNMALTQAAELLDNALKANVRIDPRISSLVYYNCACARALENNAEGAMVLVEKAMDQEFGLLDQLQSDPDLAAVRALPSFSEKLAAWETKVREVALQHAKVKLASGETFPFSFELTDVSGTPINLADFRGKVCVVNVWGTWAQPCLDMIPSFIRLQERFGPQGFQMIGLNREPPETPEVTTRLVTNYIAALGINYPCAIASHEVVAQIPRYHTVPTTLFIDRSGKIRAETHGWDGYYHFEAMVSVLLEEAVPAANGVEVPAAPADGIGQ